VFIFFMFFFHGFDAQIYMWLHVYICIYIYICFFQCVSIFSMAFMHSPLGTVVLDAWS
jgi:hypothetical protein